MHATLQTLANSGLHTAIWMPWPSSRALPPDQHVLHHLAGSHSHLVALLGSDAIAQQGRFGIVGIPAATQLMQPGPNVIRCAIDQRPQDVIRIVALGYELGAPEVFLPITHPPRQQPAGWIADLHTVLVVDHHDHTYTIISLRDDPNAQQHHLLLQTAIQTPLPLTSSSTAPSVQRVPTQLIPITTDADHMQRIRIVQQAIAAGDIYQANLTRRLRLQLPADHTTRDPYYDVALLSALCQQNPVGHSAYLRWPGHAIISNSMETLLTYAPRTRALHTYPIKGTCARAGDPLRDQIAQDTLRAHPKERAEHVMIVDLLRNDLGKIAVPGSVHVPHLMDIEGFHGIFHGISTIQATLAPEYTPGHAMAALFPGGSITGAPKRRAMQIISQLEQEPRGFYTGSVAVIFPDDTLSASILIRTIVKDQHGMSLSVGGGIVADSDPEREVRETWEKVAVFKHVLSRHH